MVLTFDIGGTGTKVRIAWTDPNYRNGFLALDRNGDGQIDSGKELFGDATLQETQTNGLPNGFNALAWFDEPQNGGNGDGVIDARDMVWPKLLVWIDENHDGISQPQELHKLEDLGVYAISLKYKETRRTDQFGNLFWFKGELNPEGSGSSIGGVERAIYDVLLSVDSSQKCKKN